MARRTFADVCVCVVCLWGCACVPTSNRTQNANGERRTNEMEASASERTTTRWKKLIGHGPKSNAKNAEWKKNLFRRPLGWTATKMVTTAATTTTSSSSSSSLLNEITRIFCSVPAVCSFHPDESDSEMCAIVYKYMRMGFGCETEARKNRFTQNSDNVLESLDWNYISLHAKIERRECWERVSVVVVVARVLLLSLRLAHLFRCRLAAKPRSAICTCDNDDSRIYYRRVPATAHTQKLNSIDFQFDWTACVFISPSSLFTQLAPVHSLSNLFAVYWSILWSVCGS